jgi:hypothetical protein
MQKHNLYNYIISYDLVNITPLNIRVKLAYFFRNNEEFFYKLLLEHKSYIKYYREHKTFRIIFHAKEYYKSYLNEALYYIEDNDFKKNISDKLL